MSDEDKEFGTPERADRPRRDGHGPRNNRPESSREQRPNRYGVPRDGSRPQRDRRTGQPRGERPTFGERASRPDREDRPRYGDRPQRGDRPRNDDRPQRTERHAYGARSDRGDRPRYGDRDGAGRGDRPQRPAGERSSYGGRPDRNDRNGRPTYSDRGPRSDRTERTFGDRPQRSNERNSGDRAQRGERSYGDRPQRPHDRSSYGDRPERPRYGERGGRPDRAGAPRTGARNFGDRDDRRPRFEEPELTEEQRMARELRMVRPHHDDPWIDDDVTDDMLDKAARNELKTLTKENAERVAKHLVMAVRLMDENPELAHQHVLSAARRAGRIAIVRETLGITAYAIGDFALALRELRTYRRISGSNEQIALMVDSERGVGRPDKALELGRSVDKSTLSEPTQVALAIAMSGARLDLDQVDLALAELEIPQLDPSKAFTYSPALFHAYAEVLEELGRHQEAAEWSTCAEVAEKALIDAQLIASTDEDEQDIVVFEEEIVEDQFDLVSEGPLDVETLALADVISSGAFEESESAEVELSDTELNIAEQDALIAEGIGPDDLLEDDVRQILIETAHLDEEGK